MDEAEVEVEVAEVEVEIEVAEVEVGLDIRPPLWGPDEMDAYTTPPSGGSEEFHLHFAGSLRASTREIRKNDFTPAVELETLPAERSGSAYTTPPSGGWN